MHRSIVTRATSVAALAGTLALAACGQQQPAAPAARAPAGPPPTPTLDQLKSATVSGVFDQAVTLSDGRYEGPPAAPGAASRPTLALWIPAIKFGNVDGKPGSEAVAMLSSDSGGSGERVYVAVFGVRDGALANLATAEVGDRTRLQNLWVQGGKIAMDVVEAGPKDPACCPTQLARKTYVLADGALKLENSEALGTLTMGTMAANEWQLVSIDGHSLPVGAKAPVIHFERDAVRGFAGCNRINGKVTETAPGHIKIGPVAATRMACPEPAMTVEQDFLSALDRVSGYTFVAGQLALTWSGKDGSGTLLFSK
jgi:heat shock protein HslJ